MTHERTNWGEDETKEEKISKISPYHLNEFKFSTNIS